VKGEARRRCVCLSVVFYLSEGPGTFLMTRRSVYRCILNDPPEAVLLSLLFPWVAGEFEAK
jgi:hypothetical protein